MERQARRGEGGDPQDVAGGGALLLAEQHVPLLSGCGAVRPTPSPDGRWLAFVRRVDNKSWLHLKDLRSGEIIRLYGPIERDMQEIWAMQGVYPSMAWTPDARSVVLWSAAVVVASAGLSGNISV